MSDQEPNEARIFNTFFETTVPPTGMTNPTDTLIISDNKIIERTSTSSSGPVIRIKNRTGIPSQGYKNVFIIDNVFPVKAGTTNHNDIQFDTGTGFTNVVVKGNLFRANGVLNADSYIVAENYLLT